MEKDFSISIILLFLLSILEFDALFVYGIPNQWKNNLILYVLYKKNKWNYVL